MRKTLAVLLVSALLAGCAHTVSRDLRKAAREDLDVEGLFRSPREFAGSFVILGGEIINSVNTEAGAIVEVLQRPLDRRGRPEVTDESRGRFLVFHEGYLETAIYRQGRRVTVAGVVKGVRKGRVDKAPYYYPFIESRELHLIRRRSPAAPRVHFGVGVFHVF
jgi:outer membrane lipoprotein